MRVRSLILLVGGAIAVAGAAKEYQQQVRWPACGPVDSAVAAQVHTVDSATGKPLARVEVGVMGAGGSEWGRTDSLGFACLRELAADPHVLGVTRIGYGETTAVVRTTIGTTARVMIAMRRVERPCCDLRGEWAIRLDLDSAAPGAPKPTARTTSGTIRFGYNDEDLFPADAGIDDVVRAHAGRFAVDLTPFFGGPYARDVSTSIVGSGPDMLRQATPRGTCSSG